MGHKKLCQALDKKNMRKIIEVLVGSFHLKICNQSLGFDLKGFHCISSLIRAFLESVKICFMPPVWKVGLWVLTSKGSVSRSVVGAGPQRSAAGILGPWDSGGGLAGVTRSGQDRAQGIWAQDCGSWAPFVPSFTSFLLPLCYSLKLGATQKQTWLQNRTQIEISDMMELMKAACVIINIETYWGVLHLLLRQQHLN